MKLVIVGGVAAGATAAARARRLSEDAEIIILERGGYISFANCGLPYHIGGEIKERDDLLIVTPEHMRENFNIDVRTGHEVLAIDREQKQLTVSNHETGSEYRQPYDKLLLCQGAAPVKPSLPGIDHPRLFTLRDLPDMDAIEEAIAAGAREAVVIGANYIGLEVMEALSRRGLTVQLVEMQKQVMPSLDREMTTSLEQHIEDHGVRFHPGVIAESFEGGEGHVTAVLSDGERLEADLVVLAVGVRPEVGLAHKAGLELGETGGVRVDRHMRTSDPDIYAAGDMVETLNTITGDAALIPLAGPANRQGRTAANHIMGRDSTYESTQGTAILKVFGMTAARTGATEKNLKAREIPFNKIYLHPYGHASYYPGTEQMHLKLLFSPGEGRILGAQIVGRDGVDKRIDVLATALRAGLTVFDLRDLELAYAPPYGSAKDPVNMAGFVAANMLRGDVEFWYAEDYPEKTAGGIIVDVRTRREYSRWHIEGAVNIPLHELRTRLDEVRELAGGRPIYLHCLVGIRSYNAWRILHNNGFTRIFNLAGGRRTFESVHR